MPGATPGKTLDLSKLTDDEAKHVWEVVQRDFDLRKKEEDRLGDLKTKIEKEDTKREILGNTTSLSETHCIRCLQPFKFLVSSKRQCLDCQLLVCKSCTRYNKKEQGWVCDPCHMARVLKIGTLEWYHANVRTRFKRFGSAKVMRSLFKRLSGGSSCSQDDLVELQEYDVQSIPEIHSGFEESSVEASESPGYKGMKKTKRRLIVDPFDFDMDCDYSIAPVGRPNQMFEEPSKSLNLSTDVGVELGLTPQDDVPFFDNRTIGSRSTSRLSYSSCGSGSVGGRRGGRGSFIPGTDDTEDDDDIGLLFPSYRSHSSFWNQESTSSPVPSVEISELDRRMSAIETFLNRLEHKMHPVYDETKTPQSGSPLPQWEEVDLEEQQLRQKLHLLTHNISDHSLSSDEDEDEDVFVGSVSSQDVPSVRSPEGDVPRDSSIFSRPESRASFVVSRLDEKSSYSTDSLEKQHPLEEGSRNSFRGSAALLVQLEDQIAQAAAEVQNTQSQVSLIEDRIAALSAAGMHVERKRRSATPVQTRKLPPNFPTKNY